MIFSELKVGDRFLFDGMKFTKTSVNSAYNHTERCKNLVNKTIPVVLVVDKPE